MGTQVLIVIAAVTAFCGPMVAQTPRDTLPAVIRAGKVFDSESGTMLGPREILVKGGRISAVGEKVDRPANARIIDLTKYTVLPGLIDAHIHLLNLENPVGGISLEGVRQLVIEGLPLRTLHGAARARTFLQAGITTVRDLGNSGRFGDVALRDAINDGSVDGPRMIVSGPGLAPVGGQFPGLKPEYQQLAADEYRIVRGVEDAAQAVRENVTFGAQVIKIYSNNTPNPGYLSLEEIKAIVAAAKMHGVRVAAHATNDAAVYRAALAGVNSVEHAYQVADSTLVLMAKNGVTLVATDIDSLTIVQYMKLQNPTAPALNPSQVQEFLRGERERLTRAIKAGVTITAGSDNYLGLQWPQGYAARRVLFAYRAAGMTAAQVLQAATINDARLLGREGQLGVIKPGAFADIIAIEGDPDQDFSAIERIKFVMKEGTVYVGQ